MQNFFNRKYALAEKEMRYILRVAFIARPSGCTIFSDTRNEGGIFMSSATMSTPAEAATPTTKQTVLNPELKSQRAQEFEDRLGGLVVGQERAVQKFTGLYQTYLAGMQSPGRPVGTLMFLGPTGSGKTRVVEAAAEVLFGDPNAVIKIDCAEFQHAHEIAKLIGAPPGYLGHRETSPMLVQENLDKYHTETDKLTFVLFDEIEKASDALWQLLLGILDKGQLTLGDNRHVDFSNCIICFTSNLGAKEMSTLINGAIGFAPARAKNLTEGDLDDQIYRTALEAARHKFSPEFMNRIDKVVVFRSLRDYQLRLILELEITAVQNRIMKGSGEKFVFTVDEEAKEFFLRKGTDIQYGARHLKRAIERYLVYAIANLVATGQAVTGDLVYVDFDTSTEKLLFSKEEGGALVNPSNAFYAEMREANLERQIEQYNEKYKDIKPHKVIAPQPSLFHELEDPLALPPQRYFATNLTEDESREIGSCPFGSHIQIGWRFLKKDKNQLTLLP
jgi:ATP-dependent Clp protease ATP-binding subunit ClpA